MINKLNIFAFNQTFTVEAEVEAYDFNPEKYLHQRSSHATYCEYYAREIVDQFVHQKFDGLNYLNLNKEVRKITIKLNGDVIEVFEREVDIEAIVHEFGEQYRNFIVDTYYWLQSPGIHKEIKNVSETLKLLLRSIKNNE